MASVNWEKATTSKAGAMKNHNGKKERVNVSHSNTDIDKSKSHLNVYIGADDYAPMYEKVKARIKQVDKEHPPKRNQGDRRITCILLETPVPQEITDKGKATDFLYDAHKVIEDFFGAENVGGTCGHFDEQHLYLDKDGVEKLSLVHGHTLCAAYAEWTDKKTGEKRVGINGKNCETKARLKALNKAMCDMCREKYGVEYNTGEQAKHKTVEQLKAESELAELVKRNDDFVRSLTPNPTKKVKTLFGEKEVEKTEAELERDREILAVQAVLRREEAVAQNEEQLKSKVKEFEAEKQTFAAERQAFKAEKQAEKQAVEADRKSLEAEKKSFLQVVAIKARQIADKFLKTLGLNLNRRYNKDSQINMNKAVLQERSRNEYDHNR